MPALLKVFFKQVFRPGYAMEMDADLDQWIRLLRGESARIVVTMRMSAVAYRLIYQSHSLKSLERRYPEVRRHQAHTRNPDRFDGSTQNEPRQGSGDHASVRRGGALTGAQGQRLP